MARLLKTEVSSRNLGQLLIILKKTPVSKATNNYFSRQILCQTIYNEQLSELYNERNYFTACFRFDNKQEKFEER